MVLPVEYFKTHPVESIRDEFSYSNTSSSEQNLIGVLRPLREGDVAEVTEVAGRSDTGHTESGHIRLEAVAALLAVYT